MVPEPRRILLIRPSALGDVCRTVPVLVSLKRAYPDAAVDWLVQDTFKDAVEHHPDLARAIPFARKRFGAWWRPGVAVEIARFCGGLRRAGYDLVVDCQGLARSGALAWITGAPRRVGYANAAELGWLGLNVRVPAPMSAHTVDRMLALAQAAGAEPVADMRLHAPPGDLRAVDEDPRLAGRRYAVTAPTARWPGKRWPAARFVELASRVLDERPGGIDSVVLIGAASERHQCGPLLDAAAADERIVDRIGATTVGRMMALIARSSLVIANDSAALHMAVGFDRPMVALYGPTRIERVGPYGRAADVIQHVTAADTMDHKDARGGLALMERISVDEVLARVRSTVGRVDGVVVR